MISGSDLKAAVHAATQKIGQAKGITFRAHVAWGGTMAYAAWDINGSDIIATINLPAISGEASVTRHEADLFAGYVIHEVGHTHYTDLDAFKAEMQAGAFRGRLLNGLEDPRIERASIESGLLPGARSSLSALVRSLLKDPVDGGDIRNAPFVIAVLGRVAAWGFALPPGIISIPARVQPFYDLAIDGLMRAPLDRSGTAYLRGVVQQLMDWLAKQPSTQPGDKHGSQQGSEPTDQPGDHPGDQSGDQRDDRQGDQPGDQPGGKHGDQQDGDAAGFNAGAESLTDGDIKPVEPDGAVSDAARAMRDRKPVDGLMDRYGEGELYEPIPADAADALSSYQSTLDGMGSRIGQLSNTLSRLLVSPERCGWNSQRPSGRIDIKRVSQAMAGYENVYRQRWEKPGLDTDVVLLLDCSSSMDKKGRITRTHRLTVALSSALDRLSGVRFAAMGFGFIYAGRYQQVASGSMGDAPAGAWMERSVGAKLSVFKGFDEPLSRARGKIAMIPYSANGGCTPDVPAIKACADLLRRRGAARRVLIVLTDGEGDEDAEGTRAAVRYAARAGVDVIGIGVAINISAAYPVAVTVSDDKDIAGPAMQAIVNQLSAKYAA